MCCWFIYNLVTLFCVRALGNAEKLTITWFFSEFKNQELSSMPTIVTVLPKYVTDIYKIHFFYEVISNFLAKGLS